MTGLLVVGEALVDVVTDAAGRTREHPGGSPANVAFGLARLGRQAHLLTRLGDDERGRSVLAHLEGAGVEVVPGCVGPGATSTATARLDASGAARYEFDLSWRVPDVPLPAQPLAVHTGSIAAFLEPGAATVERVVLGAHRRATVTYDPNVRPMLMGEPAAARAHVEGLVSASDVVKVSDEDLAWLAPGQDARDVAAAWLRLGPAVVVVTCGAGGAAAVSRSGRVEVTAPQVDVVDTVGAGDAFMAGLLDGLWAAGLLGGPQRESLHAVPREVLERVLRRAAAVAAITVSRAGAKPPTRAELDAWAAAHP